MTAAPVCRIGGVTIGAGRLALIAGPCLAESLELCLQVAEHLAGLCRRLDVGYVFKASYDKANRSSLAGSRGPGMPRGLEWLDAVRRRVGAPVLSDVHEVSQVAPAGQVLDCLQIPAFLCRQTDLLVAAGRAGKPVNIKKGQFMTPHDMRNIVEKATGTGTSLGLAIAQVRDELKGEDLAGVVPEQAGMIHAMASDARAVIGKARA